MATISEPSLEEAIFDPQRAIRTIPLPGAQAILAVLILPACFDLALLRLSHPLAAAWGRWFSRGLAWAGVPAEASSDLVIGSHVFAGALRHVHCLPPTGAQWLALGAFSALLYAAASRLPPRAQPIRVWIGFTNLVFWLALGYFAWRPASFPYDFSHYYRSRVAGTLALMLAIPPILGALYYVLEPSWLRRIGVTAAYLMFLAIALPLELGCVAVLCRALSLAALPIAFVLLGPVLQVLWFAAFFSGGLGGVARARADAR